MEVCKAIVAEWIVPVDSDGDSSTCTVLENHAICLDSEGKIVAIVPEEELAERYSHIPDGVKQMPRRTVIIPGLVNAHTQAGSTLLRGFGDESHDKFAMLSGAERELLTEKVTRAGLLLAAQEALRSGTTTVNAVSANTEVAELVAKQAKIRIAIGRSMPTVTDDEADIDEEIANVIEYASRKATSMIQPVLNIPTMDQVSIETLQRFGEAVAKQKKFARHASESGDRRHPPNGIINVPLHLTPNEVQDCIDNHEVTPIQILDQAGLLSSRTIASHCNCLTPAEIEFLAKMNVNVCHCPKANLQMGRGVCPVAMLIAAGVNVCLGTDHPSTGFSLDLLSEMQFAAMIGKARAQNPYVLDDYTVLKMATRNGAKALGRLNEIGSLEPGKRGDFIAVTLDEFDSSPIMTPLTQLLYAAQRSIYGVWVGGQRVVKNGKCLTVRLPTHEISTLVGEIQALRQQIIDSNAAEQTISATTDVENTVTSVTVVATTTTTTTTGESAEVEQQMETARTVADEEDVVGQETTTTTTIVAKKITVSATEQSGEQQEEDVVGAVGAAEETVAEEELQTDSAGVVTRSIVATKVVTSTTTSSATEEVSEAAQEQEQSVVAAATADEVDTSATDTVVKTATAVVITTTSSAAAEETAAEEQSVAAVAEVEQETAETETVKTATAVVVTTTTSAAAAEETAAETEQAVAAESSEQQEETTTTTTSKVLVATSTVEVAARGEVAAEQEAEAQAAPTEEQHSEAFQGVARTTTTTVRVVKQEREAVDTATAQTAVGEVAEEVAEKVSEGVSAETTGTEAASAEAQVSASSTMAVGQEVTTTTVEVFTATVEYEDGETAEAVEQQPVVVVREVTETTHSIPAELQRVVEEVDMEVAELNKLKELVQQIADRARQESTLKMMDVLNSILSAKAEEIAAATESFATDEVSKFSQVKQAVLAKVEEIRQAAEAAAAQVTGDTLQQRQTVTTSTVTEAVREEKVQQMAEKMGKVQQQMDELQKQAQQKVEELQERVSQEQAIAG